MAAIDNLTEEQLDEQIAELIGELESQGLNEASLDNMILDQRRQLDPHAAMTRSEFERDWVRKKDTPWLRRVGDGLAQTPEMFKYIFGTLGGAIADQPKFLVDPVRGLKTIAEGAARGTSDIWQLIKGTGGEVGDWFVDDEEHISREYNRYVEALKFEKVRSAGLVFGADEIFEDYAEAASFVLDPSNLIPFAGLGKAVTKAARKGVKGAAKVGAMGFRGVYNIGDKVASVAGTPRKKLAEFLGEVTRMHPGSAEGTTIAAGIAAAIGGVPLVGPGGAALLGAEGAGIAGRIIGESGEGIMNALASENVAKRFLARIADSPDVPMITRRTADLARKAGGQWAMDKAFNMVLAGVEVGTINGALQWAATGDPEGFGAGVAQGIAMSPIIGLAMPNGGGLSPQERLDWSVQNFMDINGTHMDKLGDNFNRRSLSGLGWTKADDRPTQKPSRQTGENFAKTPGGLKTLRVLAAMDGLAPELNLPRKVHFLTPEEYVHMFPEAEKTSGQYTEDGNVFIKTRKGADEITAATGLHEVGHYFIENILKSNTAAKDFVLNEIAVPKSKAKGEGITLPERGGDDLTRRELTPAAAEFKRRYEFEVDADGKILEDADGNQVRRGGGEIKDLDHLVQEMGAETLGEMLYRSDPNGLLGNHAHALRGLALQALGKMFSKVMPWRDTAGLPDKQAGGFARLDPNFQGVKVFKDLFNNYTKLRKNHLDWQDKLAEMDGVIEGRDGKTPREIIANLAPDTQLFDTEALETIGGRLPYGPAMREAFKAEPANSDEASRGPRQKGVRDSGRGEKLSSAAKRIIEQKLGRHGKKFLSLVEQLEGAIKERTVIGGWYSRRADKKGHNKLSYREMVPYGIGISSLDNLILYGWNERKLQNAIILAEELGLVTGKTRDDGTKQSAGEVMRERIAAASERQAQGQRINDELVATLFGAKYGKETKINDPRHIEFARELNRRRSHPTQTLRIDTMQGFSLLDRQGFRFNPTDVSTNNRPARPHPRPEDAVARVVEDALYSPERDIAYMDAAVAGDTKTAQALVDETAKAAGLVRSKHATGAKEFQSFSRGKIAEVDPDTNVRGFHFSNEADVFSSFRYQDSSQNRVLNSYLELGRVIDRRSAEKMVSEGKHEDGFPTGYDTVVFTEGAGVPTKQHKQDFKSGKKVNLPNTPYYVIQDKQFGGADLFPQDGAKLPGGHTGAITGYDDLAHAFSMHGEEHYVVRSPNQIKSADPITRDDAGNIIPLSERFKPESDDVRYSPERTRQAAASGAQSEAAIGIGALRKQLLPNLGFAQTMAQEGFFKAFQKANKNIAEALGVVVNYAEHTIGGWEEGGDISRENSQRLIIKYDRPEDLQTYVALLGSLAPEVQNAVMAVKYSEGGPHREYTIKVDPAHAEELTSLAHLEKFNLEKGFSYDPKKNQLIFATEDGAGGANVIRFIDDLDQQGIGGQYSVKKGEVKYPREKDYRRLLSPARLRRSYQGKSWNKLHKFADEARRRLTYKPAKKALAGLAKERRGRTVKVNYKKKGKTINSHDGIVVQPNLIFPQSKVIGNITDQQALGWNQFTEANQIADQFQASQPDAGINPAQWGEIMALRSQNGKPRTVTAMPETLAQWVADPQSFRDWWTAKVEQEPLYLQSGLDGIRGVMLNHQKAREGKIPVEMTAAHMLWAVASIAAGPFAQEAGWIAAVNQPRTWELMFDSIDGKFNLSKAAWRKHIATFSRKGMMADITPEGGLYAGRTKYPGNSVTSNLNSMHKMLKEWNGRWGQLNDIINNPDLTGPQMRDEFFSQKYGGAYLGPKILSFVLATLARDDMVIVDRWQLINLWKANLDRKTGGQPFRYQRDGTPVDTTNFYDTYVPLLSGTQGLGVFKALEFGLDKVIDQNHDFLTQQMGDVPPSRFGLHWTTWNMIKGEAVGHSSLDATQKFLLEGQFPKELGDRPAFIEEFINEPKSTEEFYRTPRGPRFRKLTVEGDYPSIRHHAG
jgi:hypothetical protein